MKRPILLAALALASTGAAPADGVGPLVQALWLVQGHGKAEAADPRNDQMVKGKLSKALGKESTLTAAGAQGLIDPTTFAKLAGPDARLDPAEIRSVLESDIPSSRCRTWTRWFLTAAPTRPPSTANAATTWGG